MSDRQLRDVSALYGQSDGILYVDGAGRLYSGMGDHLRRPALAPGLTPRPGHQVDSAAPLVCECGTTRFELRFGYYEVSARCPDCGHEEVVYGG